MTQISNGNDENEDEPGRPQDVKNKNARLTDGNSAANCDDSVIVIQSIGHGQIIANSDPQHQQPLDVHAFNSFIEQSRAEQNALLDRIENLEAAQQLGETWRENDVPAPVNSAIADTDIEDNKGGENSEGILRNKSILRRKKETPWKYQKFPFPESTYTLFITEHILSLPSLVGLITVVGSMMCLGITLKNELDNAEDGNKYGLPAGVPKEVRIAQFLGIIIG